MDKHERICRYLAACPPSISGQNGSGQTFAIACALANGFDLNEADVIRYLTLYSDRCQPPWSEREIAHKAQSAITAQHSKPRGHLIGGNGKFSPEDFKTVSFPVRPATPAIIHDHEYEIEKFLNGFRCGQADLWEASPIRTPEDWTQDGICLLETLYQPGEIINFITKFKLSDLKNGLTKPVPQGYGESVERDALISLWRHKGMPQSEVGGWIRMNPVDGNGIADANITAFRFILLEFDQIPMAMQMSLLSKLPLPISVILTSGGRSIHAWVKADCADLQEYRATSAKLLTMLSRFGLDTKNKNPSRLSRLVGLTRTVGAEDDGRQKILFLNPKPSSAPIL